MSDGIFRPEQDPVSTRWIATKRHVDPETQRTITTEDGKWRGPDFDRNWLDTFKDCLERCRELNA